MSERDLYEEIVGIRSMERTGCIHGCETGAGRADCHCTYHAYRRKPESRREPEKGCIPEENTCKDRHQGFRDRKKGTKTFQGSKEGIDFCDVSFCDPYFSFPSFSLCLSGANARCAL